MNVIRVYDPLQSPIGARQGYAAQIDCSRIEGLFIAKVLVPIISSLTSSSPAINIGPMTGWAGPILYTGSTIANGDWLIVWDDGFCQSTTNLGTFAAPL